MTTSTFILGKDASFKSTIEAPTGKLFALGFNNEKRSWLNPVDGIWSVRRRDRDCPLLFTNGKGALKLACMASALSKYFARLSANFSWTHYYLGQTIAARAYVHDTQ